MPRFAALLVVLLAALALGACGSSSDDEDAPAAASTQAPAASFGETAPKDAAAKADAKEILLVDVREDDEWDAGHAAQAVHVPLGELEAKLADVEAQADGRPVVFICRSGNRSAEAARIAIDGGLVDVTHVPGGMGAWVDAGLPLVPADGTVL